MEVTFVIPEDILQNTVKDAVMREVSELVRRAAMAQVQSLVTPVHAIVSTFLKQELTEEKLKQMVRDAGLDVIRERLENM